MSAMTSMKARRRRRPAIRYDTPSRRSSQNIMRSGRFTAPLDEFGAKRIAITDFLQAMTSLARIYAVSTRARLNLHDSVIALLGNDRHCSSLQ
jgi:hypothetical protein